MTATDRAQELVNIELTLLRIRVAWLQLKRDFLLSGVRRAPLAKYNPDQPRVPAGDPDGGQWTSGGGGGGAVFAALGGWADGGNASDAEASSDWTGFNDEFDDGQIHLAQDDSSQQYSVDLREEEGRGGHAIRRHVGKSDQELRDTVQRDRRRFLFVTYARISEGSFASIEAANDFVNQTLQANRGMVDQVSRGNAADGFVSQRFGYVTGREAFRPSVDSLPYVRNTYGAGVYIVHDRRSPRGYRVHTAYPLNKDPNR